MAISISQAQAALENNNPNFLLSKGEQRDDVGVSLDRTDSAILRVAAKFVEDCQNNLISSDHISSGTLSKSIVPRVKEWGNGINVVEILVAPYYKFVDKGVVGWQDKRGSGSQYKFKKGSGAKGGNPASNPFIVSLRKWLIRESRAFRNTKVAVTTREKKRATITDTSTREAMRLAYFIKKGGLSKSNFWTDALTELEKDIATGIADALRLDIIESL
jgi:hypothetical protein